LALAGLFGQVSSANDVLAKAEELYRHADYQASLTLIGESGQASGKAYDLIGRDNFMLGDYKKASEALERAFAMEPRNAEYALWLGRSFGRRAETSLPMAAPRYAAKARAYFEKAVALDPGNEQALNDLFDYYLEAPGFRGGGYDKAEQVAKRIGERDAPQGQLAQAELADRRKQFDTAGEKLRRAADVGAAHLNRWLDLARNLARQGRVTESEAAFDQAEQLAPLSREVRLARAQTYIEQKRNLDRAKDLLNEYLRNLPAVDPGRKQAEKLLQEASFAHQGHGAAHQGHGAAHQGHGA
jgi:cytochrome c-type biogenesis protein CcmH/NrfG